MSDADNTLDPIASVYADVRPNIRRCRSGRLSGEMRMAFIAVYFAGRRNLLDEQTGR